MKYKIFLIIIYIISINYKMSVNWNYFKTINKKVKGFNPMENVYFPKNKAGS
jgi:hypothetical protein